MPARTEYEAFTFRFKNNLGNNPNRRYIIEEYHSKTFKLGFALYSYSKYMQFKEVMELLQRKLLQLALVFYKQYIQSKSLKITNRE